MNFSSQRSYKLALCSRRKFDYFESLRIVEILFAGFIDDSYISFGIVAFRRDYLINLAKLKRCFVALVSKQIAKVISLLNPTNISWGTQSTSSDDRALALGHETR